MDERMDMGPVAVRVHGLFTSTTTWFLEEFAVRATTPAFTYELDFYPEMKELIHAHWYRFPPVSYLWHLLMGAIVCALGVVSITGNAAVAYIFSQTRGLRNPSNGLIVNLAISDFAMMMTNCPMYFMSSLQGKWIFGVQACRFYGFCGALFGCASILTMAAIAVDRYFVICKPFLIMKSAMTRERAKFAIVFVWIYSLVWAVIPLSGISSYVLEGFLTTCTFDYLDPSYDSRTFIFSMFCGAYIAPLSAVTISYMFIVWEVFAHSRKFKKAATKLKIAGNKANEELKSHKKEVKTAKIAAIIIGCWITAWTPYAVVALLGILTDGSYLTPIASQLPALFAKTAAVYNPIVYAISHPKYREALRNKFPILGLCIKGGEDEERGSTAGTPSGSAPTHGRSTSGKTNLQQQISTTSQAESVDSELSDVQDETEATPQGKRKASTSRNKEKSGKASGSPVPAIRSNSAAKRLAEHHMVDTPDAAGLSRSQAVFQEIQARYSKGDQHESVTFTNHGNPKPGVTNEVQVAHRTELRSSGNLPPGKPKTFPLPDLVANLAPAPTQTFGSSDLSPVLDMLDLNGNAKVTTV